MSGSVSATSSNPTSFPSSVPSPSPSASQRGGSGGGGNSTSSFYKNLFYILIGLLCVFGLVSFLSLWRARRRRTRILQEAERLGVLVPGLPGYIPVRDRSMLTWQTAAGTTTPDWWEIEQKGTGSEPKQMEDSATVNEYAFNPLGLIPPMEKLSTEPTPISALPYFPNHLAYRPESLMLPPSRYKADDPSSLDGLDGESLEVLTIIQMPREPWPEGRAVEEEEAIIKEWSNIELGLVKLPVRSARPGHSNQS